jgi:FdhD protein
MASGRNTIDLWMPTSSAMAVTVMHGLVVVLGDDRRPLWGGARRSGESVYRVRMRAVTKRRIVRYGEESSRPTMDSLAAEEPLEIRVDGQTVAVTMRTPGHDFELALGFCLTEGVVERHDDVATIRYCSGRDDDGQQTYNVVDIRRRVPEIVEDDLRRRVYTSSSCGICGTASIDAVRKDTPSLDDDCRIGASTLLGLPDALRGAQRIFDRTGGLHAAGLFTVDGELIVAREDVGRHNAVDKVLGWAAAQERLPLTGHVLAVSGRVAFEIVQKALRGGVPVIAAVSAPTSLAVSLAAESGLTLAGFIRGTSMNVYSAHWRVRD